jgi:regulator of sigma E protease
MSFLIFLVVLAILVFVHELGHFIAAKKSGIKVTEFGIGFPPRIFGVQRGETLYSFNAIPFGGFVKIFGEDPDEESLSGSEKGRSIGAKPKYIQSIVLVAGVTFNILFAWILISLGYMIGLPTSSNYAGPGNVENIELVVTDVTPSSPAAEAGVMQNDRIVGLTSEGKYRLDELNATAVSNFIEAHGREGVVFSLVRSGELIEKEVVAREGVIANRVAIGIGMDTVGLLQLPPHLALYAGGLKTIELTKATFIGIVGFLGSVIIGSGDFDQVTGPVGIAGLVGDVTALGFVYLLSFTALISINLAVINLLPFPALDGGRLLFIAIESIIRRPIPVKVVNWLNGAGFVFLLIIMAIVTINDIIRIL